jgi:hypothetical protein
MEIEHAGRAYVPERRAVHGACPLFIRAVNGFG